MKEILKCKREDHINDCPWCEANDWETYQKCREEYMEKCKKKYMEVKQ